MASTYQDSLFDVSCDLTASSSEVKRRIDALIEAGNDVMVADKNGVTPLHFAARFRNIAAVVELIANGAEVNAACKRSGSTPLHRAVYFTGAPGTAGKEKERLAIIELLIGAGASPRVRNKSGNTPEDYAADSGAQALLQLQPHDRYGYQGDGDQLPAAEDQ
jgi:ankyrin repeat protein